MAKDEVVMIPIPSGSSGMSVPQMMPEGKENLLKEIKPEAIVEVIRHRLLGEEFKEGKWVEVPALKDRKLTDIGAWEIANLMLGVSSINISISKLKEREIKERLARIAKSTQYLLIANWREYGIKNTSQFYYVHEIVFSNTMAVLCQAGDASIQELLKGIVHENRNYTMAPKENKSQKIGRMLGLTD